MPEKRLDEERQPNREVLNEVLWWVLKTLTLKHNPSTESRYYHILCGDGNLRHCKPVLAAWLADCPECSGRHHLERHDSLCCECPKNELGDYIPPDMQHPRRDDNLYRTLSDANSEAAIADLSPRHVDWGFKVFRHIPCIVSDLQKPDLLHTMQIGMLDYVQKWILQYMKMHERLDEYKAIWLSVPAYQDLTPKTMSYEEVSQWNWKEMKEMSRHLLGVVTQSLRGGSPTQRRILNVAIEYTWQWLQFYLYALYVSHNDATMSYMEDALGRLHTFKDVFLLGWAGKKATATANTLRTVLMKKRKVDKGTNADTWTPSKKRREMDAC